MWKTNFVVDKYHFHHLGLLLSQKQYGKGTKTVLCPTNMYFRSQTTTSSVERMQRKANITWRV